MSILDPIRELAYMIRASFSWDVVEVTVCGEIEHNSLTGAYRWRIIGNDGPWMAGVPRSMINRAMIEEDITFPELAQMLAPPVMKAMYLDFGTEELTGYAVRFPSGKVVTWREGEPTPDEVEAANPDYTFVR